MVEMMVDTVVPPLTVKIKMTRHQQRMKKHACCISGPKDRKRPDNERVMSTKLCKIIDPSAADEVSCRARERWFPTINHDSPQKIGSPAFQYS